MAGEGFTYREPDFGLVVRVVAEARSVRAQFAEEPRNSDYGGSAIHDEIDRQLEGTLDRILSAVEEAMGPAAELADSGTMTAENAEDVFATAHLWASIASRAVGEVYAPASPFPGNWAGWGRRVAAKLQQIAAALGPPLHAAAHASGATGVSVYVAFPFGVSVSINW